jgi:predicted enzyme related to lactoylglutathione lyase
MKSVWDRRPSSLEGKIMKTTKYILAAGSAASRRPPRPCRWLVFLAAVSAGMLLSAADAPQLPPLTTVSGSPRLPGKFIWGDLVTTDVEAARKFYGRLLGWTFRASGAGPGAYTIAMNDERPLCGMVQAPPRAGTNGNPRWVGYISVPSVARAQKAVLKAGGRECVAPRKLPKRGEQAIFADPEGAIFGVMTSSSGDPEDFLADPGDWIWIQLLCRDARKATAFYRAVAGYDVTENSDSQWENDFVLVSGKFARATVMEIPRSNLQVRSAWLPFVRVKNVTASVTQAEQLGGKVVLAPKAELFAGKIAVIADPTGAAIGLLEWDGTSKP